MATFSFDADSLEVREFVPPKRSQNPNNKTGLDYFDDTTRFVIKRKYIYDLKTGDRFCNLDSRTHHDKWYSSHDQNGDAYWCPDCSDAQYG